LYLALIWIWKLVTTNLVGYFQKRKWGEKLSDIVVFVGRADLNSGHKAGALRQRASVDVNCGSLV